MSGNINSYIDKCVALSQKAGAAIMDIYQRDFDVESKQDNSPLTEADLASHNIIVDGLQAISEFPVLSEESAETPWEERQSWQTYWLVDPLDGTKEFIKKNGEFTVNIALIHNGEPVLGVVYAPALNTTYIGELSSGAWKIAADGTKSPLTPVSADNADIVKVVGSRSHQSPEIKGFLASLGKEAELVAMGSSLKLCLVAEGKAHLYPRLGPTSEWDTAAAHAVVTAANANVTVMEKDSSGIFTDSGKPLTYNQKESILNPYFLVSV
ncbi:MAG: 3'(2'),5'-bisphosphate nucleotidase CysQ [Aestuariibacter sp.]